MSLPQLVPQLPSVCGAEDLERAAFHCDLERKMGHDAEHKSLSRCAECPRVLCEACWLRRRARLCEYCQHYACNGCHRILDTKTRKTSYVCRKCSNLAKFQDDLLRHGCPVQCAGLKCGAALVRGGFQYHLRWPMCGKCLRNHNLCTTLNQSIPPTNWRKRMRQEFPPIHLASSSSSSSSSSSASSSSFSATSEER